MLTSIKILFSQFVQICLFKQGPESIPYSIPLMVLLLGLSAIVGTIINLLELPIEKAVLSILLNLVVLTIFTQLILGFYNKASRFIQTMSAQLGTSIVLSIFALPLLVMTIYAERNNVNTASITILWTILLAWDIAVMGNIFRHAIASSFLNGLLIALAFPLLMFQITRFLFPTL